MGSWKFTDTEWNNVEQPMHISIKRETKISKPNSSITCPTLNDDKESWVKRYKYHNNKKRGSKNT